MYWISTLLWTSFVVICQSLASFVPYIKPGESNPSCTEYERTQTYCEDIEDYPTDEIRNVTQKYEYTNVSREFMSFIFDNDFDELHNKTSRSKTNLHFNTSVDHREEEMQERKADEQLCHSKARTIPPKAAKNKDNKWFFIINIDKYKQEIEIDACVQKNNETVKCKTELLKEGVVGARSEAKCEQVYREIKLVVLDPTGEKLSSEQLLLPSCCKCIIN